MAKVVKINFFPELWELTKDSQQFKEYLLKRKQLNLGESYKLCSVLMCSSPIPCPQLCHSLVSQQCHSAVSSGDQRPNSQWKWQIF